MDDIKLPKNYSLFLSRAEEKNEKVHLAMISLWEIAKLLEYGKIKATIALDEWFSELARDPLIEILPLTPQIILESTRLGSAFHKDPADQIIVATARCHELKLLTCDERIKNYKNVTVL